jgi:putative spermidine/putrescine transport system ATP-binding protein
VQQTNERAPLIRLKGVRKVFGGTPAVSSLNLAIEPGEFFTFLGPSGSGKTTTLRMIAGFEQPDTGQIELGGQDLSRLPPHQRDVNTVFQDYALFPHLTLLENVAYGLRAKKILTPQALQRAEQALASVQRVALARAIVNRPRVLLLDEPLGALDLKLRHQMQVELKALQQQTGITFIYVTHDQDEALTMSDRIAVFNHGCVEQVATPWVLYEQPQTAFVAGFVGITNIIERHGASFALRPEKIRLLAPDAPQDRLETVPATIVGVSYLGMSTRFLLHCADGRRLTVVEQNVAHGAQGPRLVRGSAVVAAWSAAAPWPLAA